MKTLLNVVGVLALGLMGGRSWATSPESPPLPAVETIVARAWARAQQEPDNDQRFNAQYGYKRSKVTEYRNIRGNLTKRKEKITVNEPTPGRAGDLRQSAVDGTSASTNRISSDVSSHKREMLKDTNLLNRFTFVLQGRETINGRQAFVVDFQPASGKLPSSTLKDRFLNKAAGRIWVDEEDYALVKADARLTGTVNVVGGLVATVHKFKFAFGRERTEDGLWFTHLLTWRVEAREVIVERVIDCVETRTDVRKAQ